jgi:predicted nucleotidyltransferase
MSRRAVPADVLERFYRILSDDELAEAGRLIERTTPAAEAIVVFGSYSRGTMESQSDVDFLVVTAADPERRPGLVGLLSTAFASTFHKPSDMVVVSLADAQRYAEARGMVVHHALATGRVLYQTQAGHALVERARERPTGGSQPPAERAQAK